MSKRENSGSLYWDRDAMRLPGHFIYREASIVRGNANSIANIADVSSKASPLSASVGGLRFIPQAADGS
jgi:hypothetical protein